MLRPGMRLLFLRNTMWDQHVPRYQVKSHVTYSEAAWTTGKVSEVVTETVPFRIRVILPSARH